MPVCWSRVRNGPMWAWLGTVGTVFRIFSSRERDEKEIGNPPQLCPTMPTGCLCPTHGRGLPVPPLPHLQLRASQARLDRSASCRPERKPECRGNLGRRRQREIAFACHEAVQLGRGDVGVLGELVMCLAATPNRLSERFVDPPRLLPARFHDRPLQCDLRVVAKPLGQAAGQFPPGRPAPPLPAPSGRQSRRPLQDRYHSRVGPYGPLVLR